MVRLYEYNPYLSANSNPKSKENIKKQKRLITELYNSTSGAACYGFPAYSAKERIWKWFEAGPFTSPSELEAYILTSHTTFSTSLNMNYESMNFMKSTKSSNAIPTFHVDGSNELTTNSNVPTVVPCTYTSTCTCSCYLIEEKVIGKAVGMIWVTNNSPLNLTLSLSHFCLTPAYRGSYVMPESAYLLLREYFGQGYRRIEVSVDEENLIAKKYLLALGFLKEGTLRKSQILRQSNRDSAIFSMTNSEWKEPNLQFSRDFLLSRLVCRKYWASAQSGNVHTKIIDHAIDDFIENCEKGYFAEALLKLVKK